MACDSGSDSQVTDTNSDETIVLRMSHFMPAPSVMNTQAFEPWAKKIEEESNGRIKIENYPGAMLSEPDATYDAAAKGTVDIGIQLQGYTSGRFPLSQIAELPGMSNSALQMSCLMQTLYDNGTIAGEYDDTHVLALWGLGPGVLHSNEPIAVPSDMKGLRIRRPSAVAGDIIESMGAAPVGLPATDIYTSLQRGVIDGLSLPWDGVPIFRVNELVDNHTNIPLYSSSFVMTMNKAKYDSLPDDLKKVIDDNSGMVFSQMVGNLTGEGDITALQAAKDAGNNIIDIPDPLNDPNWSEPLKQGSQKYLDSLNISAADADAIYKEVQEVSQACKI
ncbi:TRAP transporter substrate-binding protein [Psychrobacter sp. F1192]|uniref:TRAP transporter substrate-binding protein n=2 Tax=Psychrobacter coccoides TaxID=2818440 RepID=A0ABS3NRH6_9GAMM|nr:TRAP transporter substrate-binding protein [Psychrobacter coccoides]